MKTHDGIKLPVLYCPVVVFVVVADAALVWPSCSPYPPADEPKPITIIPDRMDKVAGSYIISMRAYAASDSLAIDILAIDLFLFLLSGTFHFPFFFGKTSFVFVK
jgi:hypothetical protein